MPIYTEQAFSQLYRKLTEEDILNATAKHYILHHECYKKLDIKHIKSLLKEIIGLVLNVFSPIVCRHECQKKRIISCVKDAAFDDNELSLERRKQFPTDIVTLYFMRRTNDHNIKKIKTIFKNDGLSQKNSKDYLLLMQSELIPNISNHIIKIIQLDPRQSNSIITLASQCPIIRPIFTINEEDEEDNAAILSQDQMPTDFENVKPNGPC